MGILETTIVKVFQEKVQTNQNNVFVKHFSEDQWRDITWLEYGNTVNKLAAALLEHGIQKGDRVCIMSSTRAEWGIVDLAVMSIGALTGAIYPTLLTKDASYIVNDLDARIVFVESAFQRDQLLRAKDGMSGLKHIVVFDNDAGEDPLCIAFDDFLAQGESALDRRQQTIFDAIDSLNQQDHATVIYTSGTTGAPKGALHNHEAIMYTAAMETYPLEPGMIDLSYLPMAHVFERFGGFYPHVYRGDMVIGYFRGDMQGLLGDFQELKPNVNRTAPRLLEKVYSGVINMVAAGGDEAKSRFDKALSLAKSIRVDEALMGIKQGPEKHKAFETMMTNDPFIAVHQLFGGNMKFFYGGGAPIPKEVTEFFFAAGLPVYELYGTTETIGTITNYPNHVKAGTVGVPFPQNHWPGTPGETRLALDGEIENQGPNVMLEYLNKPEETKAAFTHDGWFKSGDLGAMDESGFIAITGRKKDIIITSGGKNIAPQKIENHIKETGYFSQVLVYGDGKKYLTALVTLDPSAIAVLAGSLAIDLPADALDNEKYSRVASHPKTREFIKSVIDERNQELFKQERIVDFLILDRDLTIENNEITPTMKLKKQNVVKRFADQLDALYE
jgi:long-chain acyl-CoA synthetase